MAHWCVSSSSGDLWQRGRRNAWILTQCVLSDTFVFCLDVSMVIVDYNQIQFACFIHLKYVCLVAAVLNVFDCVTVCTGRKQTHHINHTFTLAKRSERNHIAFLLFTLKSSISGWPAIKSAGYLLRQLCSVKPPAFAKQSNTCPTSAYISAVKE